jgi:hypothetical protein
MESLDQSEAFIGDPKKHGILHHKKSTEGFISEVEHNKMLDGSELRTRANSIVSADNCSGFETKDNLGNNTQLPNGRANHHSKGCPSDCEDALEPIAIVGISFRFPQEAVSEASFWEMLMKKRCASTEFPTDRININAFHGNEATNGVSKVLLRQLAPSPFFKKLSLTDV